MSIRWHSVHDQITSKQLFLKWLVVLVTAVSVLLVPGLLTAQQAGAGGGQSAPGKSPVPPATKKDSGAPPQNTGGAPAVPPIGGAQTKSAPAQPIPQGPIKNDDDPRVKAAVA